MGLHRNPKSEEDLALDDKLDLVRTMVRLDQRSSTRRSLNAIEPQVVERHQKEIEEGKLTHVALGTEAILAAFGIGDDADGSSAAALGKGEETTTTKDEEAAA